MKLCHIAKEAIALATAIRSYWDTELPKRHPNYPVVSPGEDSGPPPPEERQLRNLLLSLSEEDIYKVLLLMSLGRGDVGPADLAGHFELLKKRFPKTSTPALPEA